MLSIRTPSPFAAFAGLTALLALAGCAKVVSGTDGQTLGYGPADAALAGYDSDPVPRPRVSAWTPPERETLSPPQLGDPEAPEPPTEPVPYLAEVVDTCERLASLGSEEERPLCLRRYRIARLFRAMDKWKGLVACVDGASKLNQAEACEALNPLAFETSAEYPRETGTCLHVLALTIVETSGVEPLMSGDELRDLAPVMYDCVDSLVASERDERGPKAYFEMLDCIDASLTTTEAEACEA